MAIITPKARVYPPASILTVLAGAAFSVSAFAQMPTTRVVVVEAQMRELPATVTLVGTVGAVVRSRVGSEVAGIVINMPVRQGDRVELGQLLCKLNDDVLSHQLAEAKARLGALKARHEELLAGTREETLARLKALVAEAEAIRQRWGFEKERVLRLYADAEAGSQKEVYDTQAEFLAARQRENAARAAYDEAVAGPRPEVIARAAYEVAEQQAAVQRLESELSKTEIRAPFAGYVVNRVVEVGEWVGCGDEVVELADLSTVLVRVDVPEAAVAYCKVGEPARVKVDALQRTFQGVIKHRIPLADEVARTFPVEVELDNADQMLAAGMFARVTVPAGPRRQAVAVPKDAVVERRGTHYVAMVAPGERGTLMGIPMPVTIGSDIGGWVAITSPNVRPGMRLAVRGNELILFPQPVEIVDEMGSPVKRQETPPEGRSPTGRESDPMQEKGA